MHNNNADKEETTDKLGKLDKSVKPAEPTNKASNKATGRAANTAITAVIFALCLIIPILLLFSAFQNPAWVNAPVTKRFESFLAGALIANINLVTVPTDQPIHPLRALDKHKLQQIRNGRYSIVSATDINSQHGIDANPNKVNNTFIIATIGPVDLSGKSLQTKHEIIEAVYNKAFNGTVDAVVESTESDILLRSDWGHREVARLRKAGAIRCVVFDGGHHIGSLGLRPDILLVPSMYYNGELYATHSFTRDSVQIEKLRQVIEDEFVGSTIVRFSRLGVPVKNSSAMGKLAYQAISNITKLANQKSDNAADNDNTDDNKEDKNNKDNNKNKNFNGYEYTPIRKNTVFISCDVGDSPSKEDILQAVKAKVKAQVGPKQPVRIVYAGLTYGTNQFPQNKPAPSFSDKELEAFLLKNLPYYTEIMSEQISTWDIIRSRAGL